MSWREYQNEIIALAALGIMFFAYIYKYNSVSSSTQEAKKIQRTIEEVKEVAALKKIWADKKTDKRVEALHTLVPTDKIKWQKKSKKLTAKYTDLRANELNKLITKVLNLPVRITFLDVTKRGANYNVELKCKW